ncbi:glycoside hydrolase family 25 domain-containing protein, partial [Staphylococcus epidermidis]
TFSAQSNITQTNNRQTVLHISQSQPLLTNQQIKQLNKNYHFIILTPHYPSQYLHNTFQKNPPLLQQNKIKYPVYSYNIYQSPKDTPYEAKTLSQ